MRPTRRELLAAGAAAAPILLDPALAATPAEKPGLGMVSHSYAIRGADKASHFDDPLAFLEFCHTLGAAGIQTALGARDEAYAEQVRNRAAEWNMFVEGSARLPRDQADVERFAREIRTAKACGASVVRTVLMTGRRYEIFTNVGQFRKFLDEGRKSLSLAKPVVERENVRLAVENHKDLEAAEQAGLIRSVDSPQVGVCVDTGNNIALLEDPLEVVETLAPLAFTVHLKDMATEEYPDGFLLSEVPLGVGSLDLARVVAVLRKAHPDIRFNLEMITRDPLRIPCLTDRYWPTLEQVPGRRLAMTLARVRKQARKEPLPRVTGLPKAEQLKQEDENVRASLRFARDKLGLPG